MLFARPPNVVHQRGDKDIPLYYQIDYTLETSIRLTPGGSTCCFAART